MKKLIASLIILATAFAATFTAGAAEFEKHAPADGETLIGADIGYLRDAPTMDGVISENEYYPLDFSNIDNFYNYSWGSAFEKESIVRYLREYATDDLKVYACWNGNNLYLAFDCYAPKAEYKCSLSGNEVYLFRAWCMQIALTDINATGTDRAEIGLGYDSSTDEMLCYENWGSRKNITLTKGEDYATNWDRDAEKVVYEVRLNLRTAMKEDLDNGDMFRLGFCLCMGDDADLATDNSQRQIEFGYGIAGSKSVDQLAVMSLVGRTSADVDAESDDGTETDPPEETELPGFSAKDDFRNSSSVDKFTLTDGSMTAEHKTDANGDSYIRLTAVSDSPIIGARNMTAGLNMDAGNKYVAIHYRSSSTKAAKFAINFTSSTLTELSREYDCPFDYALTTDGEWHTLVYDMTPYPEWAQFITAFYFCPFVGATDAAGETFDIMWVKYYTEIPTFDDEQYGEYITSVTTMSGSETEPDEDTSAGTEAGGTVATNPADTSATTGDDEKSTVWVWAVVGVVAAAAVATVGVIVIKKKKK